VIAEQSRDCYKTVWPHVCFDKRGRDQAASIAAEGFDSPVLAKVVAHSVRFGNSKGGGIIKREECKETDGQCNLVCTISIVIFILWRGAVAWVGWERT
jgi:hypothetical protein